MKYLFIIIMIIPLQILNSQDSSYLELKNTIGIKLSNITGYGVYYNRAITKDINAQIKGLGYYYMSQKNNRERINYNYDYGIELQYNFVQTNIFRVFFLAGGYYYYDNDEETFTDNYSLVTNDSYNYGVGLGFELFFSRLVINLDVGYKYYNDNKVYKYNYSNVNTHYPEVENVTKLGGGIGIGFMF